MRIFVSYNNRDRATVEPWVELLRRRRPDDDVYFAPTRNVAGAWWIETLGEELEGADAVLLCLGGAVGDWQELEYYEAFRRSRKEGRPRIVPILLEDEAPGLPFLGQLHRLRAREAPAERLVDLVLAALDEAEVGGAPDPPWRLTNPYRGLFSMGSADAAFFFGREALTADLLNRLGRRDGRITMLVGNSGVGKSSVVNAGVVAALRGGLWPGDPDRPWPPELADGRAWLPLTMQPGERPVHALALAFARTWIADPADREEQARKWAANFENGSRLAALIEAAGEELARPAGAARPARFLLNVDQGEELYARAEPSEAALFSSLLAKAAGRNDLAIIGSLRSDWYGRFQEDDALFRSADRVDVPPLAEEELEAVVRKPAAALGARFETPETVPAIVDAAAREPGSLPLLSYMLDEAWERMRGDDASDGTLRFPPGAIDVARPLVERAERFLAAHPARREALKRLFTLRVAHVTKEGEPVRRRAPRRECSDEEWSLAEELAGRNWRLLHTGEADGDATVEVAHEALLRKWPTLSRWFDEARGFLIWKGQLEAARLEWEVAPDDRKDAAVLMGLALETARRWRDMRGGDLSPEDRDFVARSEALDAAAKEAEAAKERELAEERARSETRRRRFGQLGLVAGLAGLLLSGVIGYYYVEADGAQRALASANESLEAALQEAESARDAEAAARREADLNLLTAKRNIDLAAQRQDLLESALDREEEARLAAEAATEQAQFGADRAAEERNRAESALRQAETELRRAWVERARFRSSVARELIAQGWSDGALALAAAAFPTGAPDFWDEIDASSAATEQLMTALSPDEVPRRLDGHDYFVKSVAFSPDGKLIASTSDDGTARVWDAATGAQLQVLSGHGGIVWHAAFSPDGAQLATAADDGLVRLFDVRSGALASSLKGHWGAVVSVRFSADGDVLVSGGSNAVRVWDARAGRSLQVLHVDCGGSCRADVSPDGGLVAAPVGTDDALVRSIDGQGSDLTLAGHTNEVTQVVFSPNGELLLTASRDGSARLWDAATGEERRSFLGSGDQVFAVAFAPDGERIATGDGRAEVRLWDVATGRLLRVFRGEGDFVYGVAFSPTGARIGSAAYYGRGPMLWPARPLEELVRMAKARVDAARVLGVQEECAFYLRTEGCP